MLNKNFRICLHLALQAFKSCISCSFIDEDGFSCTSTCFMKCRMLPVSLDLTCVATYFNALGQCICLVGRFSICNFTIVGNFDCCLRFM